MNINNLYFSQNVNRVGPIKETNRMENRTDNNPSGKSFAEMIVEAQLERERNNNLQNQKDSEEKSESENKKIVDPVSLSYSQMILNSLIVSSKKDEDKKRK